MKQAALLLVSALLLTGAIYSLSSSSTSNQDESRELSYNIRRNFSNYSEPFYPEFNRSSRPLSRNHSNSTFDRMFKNNSSRNQTGKNMSSLHPIPFNGRKHTNRTNSSMSLLEQTMDNLQYYGNETIIEERSGKNNSKFRGRNSTYNDWSQEDQFTSVNYTYPDYTYDFFENKTSVYSSYDPYTGQQHTQYTYSSRSEQGRYEGVYSNEQSWSGQSQLDNKNESHYWPHNQSHPTNYSNHTNNTYPPYNNHTDYMNYTNSSNQSSQYEQWYTNSRSQQYYNYELSKPQSYRVDSSRCNPNACYSDYVCGVSMYNLVLNSSTNHLSYTNQYYQSVNVHNFINNYDGLYTSYLGGGYAMQIIPCSYYQRTMSFSFCDGHREQHSQRMVVFVAQDYNIGSSIVDFSCAFGIQPTGYPM